MELNDVKIYGVAEQVESHSITRRDYITFLIKTADKSYNVIARDHDVLASTDVIQCDVEDGARLYVRGVEVADGVVMAIEVEQWGRICDVCGKWHEEGYWVDEMNYACSEECAIKLYGGDEEAFKADLALLDNPETADRAYTYWTTWEN
jgi:hypothetical protein